MDGCTSLGRLSAQGKRISCRQHDEGEERRCPSVTVFCDFVLVLVPPTDISPLVSVQIVGFVQSESRTVHTIIPWFPDAKWAPVPCGLADHPDFLLYMSLVENTAGPWFKRSVFGKLGLNNAGRRAARENRMVFRKVRRKPVHFLTRPSD